MKTYDYIAITPREEATDSDFSHLLDLAGERGYRVVGIVAASSRPARVIMERETTND